MKKFEKEKVKEVENKEIDSSNKVIKDNDFKKTD